MRIGGYRGKTNFIRNADLRINFRLLVGLAIFIGVLFLVLIRKKDNPVFAQPESIRKLPRFKTIDIFDNIVESKALKGNVLYVQFINPRDTDDIQLFQDVFSTWFKEGLRILIITSDWNAWPEEVKNQINIDIFITEKYKELKEKFKSLLNQNLQLKKISRNERICVISVLNSDYFTEEDVESLKSQLEIEFLIFLSDEELREKWSTYIRKFREDDLNNIIIVAENSGHILKIFHRDCACYKELLSIRSALTNE